MAIDWSVFETMLVEEGSDILTVVKPYLPALQRSGTNVFNDFVNYLTNKNFDEIDNLMYGKMTPEERAELEKTVLSDAHQAALDNVTDRAMVKDIGMKLAIGILTKLI